MKKHKQSQEKHGDDPKRLPDQKQAQIEELTETLQRLQAQYENFQKRTEKEQDIAREGVKSSVIGQLLPLLDAFDAAEKHASKEHGQTAISLLAEQCGQIFLSLGVTPMESLGKRFDSHIHEAMMTEEGKDNIILEEFQKGYLLDKKILRHAKVKVGKDTKISHQRK